MEISASQIREYNAINAFATDRSVAIGHGQKLTLSSETPTYTKDLESSLNLISGSLERLTTIDSNLYSMYEMASIASLNTTTDEEKYELYGKMRSLSAGIDQVIEKTQFDGQMVLDGSPLYLHNGYEASGTKIEPPSLKTIDEDGLNIATQSMGAAMEIGYTETQYFLNQESGVLGLNIGETSFVGIDENTQELDNGTYELEIIYNGPDSSIIMRDENGIEVSRSENLDLTGTGVSVAKFDVGIEIEIDRDEFPDGVSEDIPYDKWDYENLGSKSLFANLAYERLYTYNLDTGEENSNGYESRNVSFTNDTSPSPISDSNGNRLEVSNISLAGLKEDSKELESGRYSMELTYKGETSSLTIYDSSNIPIMVKSGIDLSENGDHRIELNNGISFTVNKEDFEGENQKIKSFFTYTEQSEPYLDFDYAAYAEKLEGAMEVIYAETAALEQAQSVLEQSYNIQLSFNTGDYSSLTSLAGNPNTFAASGASALLSTAITSSDPMLSILHPTQAQNQLNFTSSEVESTAVTALQTQANVNPSILGAIY